MLVTLIPMVTKITRGRSVVLLAILGIVLAFAAALFTLQNSSNPSEPSENPTQEQGVETVIGIWGSKADRPYLELKDDGSLVGHDGCNGFSGHFEVSDDGQRIVLRDLLGTLKACPGVDTWLRDARSAVIDDDTLTVYNAADDVIGSLDRE